MIRKHETEVLVVGAGPVGLFTALLLTERGVRVQIVDEQWRTGAHSYALALHPHSLKLLEQVGLAAPVLEHGYRVRSVAFYDGAERRGELNLSELPMDHPFVVVLRQDAFESLLEQRLSEAGVKVRWNHRVSKLAPGGKLVVATIDELGKASGGYAVATSEWVIERTRQTQAAFVVGADGHNSIVRRTLGLEYRSVGEPADFAVFEFQSGAELGDELRIVLTEDTTNVVWPLPDGRCRWSFQLCDAEVPGESRAKSRLAVQIGQQAYPSLSESDLHTLLQARAPWFEAKVGEINWSMAVHFESRLAERFGRDRCWLVGDAAHMTGPVGMQSMNVGLREAHELVTCLARILRENASPESLEAYSTERLSEWRQLLGVEGGLAPHKGTDPWVKQHRARILPCLPASGDELAPLVRQLGLRVA